MAFGGLATKKFASEEYHNMIEAECRMPVKSLQKSYRDEKQALRICPGEAWVSSVLLRIGHTHRTHFPRYYLLSKGDMSHVEL